MTVLQFIRTFHRKAPRIGSRIEIYLGNTKTDGREHYCIVGGATDIARPGVLLGYAIELGDMGCSWPTSASRISISVRVKLTKKLTLSGERTINADISCLNGISKRRVRNA